MRRGADRRGMSQNGMLSSLRRGECCSSSTPPSAVQLVVQACC